MKKEYVFNDIKYILDRDDENCFDFELVKESLTDYFNDYDYVFGDYAYNKLRLKGFCNKKNKLYKKINDIETLEEYISNYCAYGCKWFLLKKEQ